MTRMERREEASSEDSIEKALAPETHFPVFPKSATFGIVTKR